ncbi:Hypothetical protein CINCED_3A001922 [Cinara cedri]|uniref:Smoothelin domain-containing protein n=1 Tax=Cinara cedri TaxID=506608 RepID=A0A5E4MP90_9HEMI|nr:Hypothetical protein CINCED_3A001922 [Cinara cedri]
MATELGSDIALIQDEDMLRKMWQQTEDFGKKKEIRMRMYKLREQRLKEFYTTGEMIQTETTSKRSSTRTHTESITDQGFMTMKTKEIRDSESPTEDYQRQSNTNTNYYVSSKNDETDSNKGIGQIEQLTGSIKPSNEYTQNSIQTSLSSSASSKWESSQTVISVSEEIEKADVNSSSKLILNEQKINDYQLTYDTSLNKHNDSNIDTNITESITATNVDSIKREGNTHNNRQYVHDRQGDIETYTTNTSNVDSFEPITENIQNKNITCVDTNYSFDVSTNNSENVIVTNNKIINERKNLDSYLPTEQLTDLDTKSNEIMSNVNNLIKKNDDHTEISPKENPEGQYVTTYQHSYQQPRISVDVSPSHEAFARSLRSTPERSSPSPCRERASPERRFKSVSPEKYRAPREKSGSPPKSTKSSSRRKLSSTYTKDSSKKRVNTLTRGEKYDSSDDSDCSGATHGTYDKYKNSDAKRTLFKEENKITSTSKYYQKSPSTSPVRREKSPGYSSEGSVAKEVRKSSINIKKSSHERSPERSAFKPVKNYKITRTQHDSQDDKISNITQEENVSTNSYTSKNSAINVNNCIKVINDEDEVEDYVNKNTVTTTQDIVNNIVHSKNKHIQEKLIIEEQTCKSEEVDNAKLIKESKYDSEINKTSREKLPSKEPTRVNRLNQDEFIENEKLNLVKESTTVKSISTVKPQEKSPVPELKPKEKSPVKSRENSLVKEVKSKEKSPVKEVKPRENSPVKEVKLKEKSPLKEVKPVTKDITKTPVTKSSEKISPISNNKSVTTLKITSSAIPSSVKKTIIEKTPSKKNLMHNNSKENVLHKTVKKDLSKEKVEIKITRNDSKALIHKNSKETITPKIAIKKPSQELLVDKKTTISYRNKVTSSENKPKAQEPIKVIEKKDSKTKLKPSISPQSSQKKLVAIKPNVETKTTTDVKRITENKNVRRIPATSVTRPKTYTTTKLNVYETPSKVSKPNSKTIPTSLTMKSQIRKTTQTNSYKTIQIEETKNVDLQSKDLQDEMPPDNFESDTDLDDSPEKPTYTHINSSKSSTTSSSSEEDEDEKDGDDIKKIKELDNIRIEAEEEYGKKMTNKDALLNVLVQLPPSSRESSPEYSTRFGQPYHSVSDDASLPRYADVVSEPEDVNDCRLYNNRYDIVTDLDEETTVTVADRVSKFLNNVNKQDEVKTTEIVKSPQAVKKAKQIFESIANGQTEETDISDEEYESEVIHIEVHDSPKNTNTQTPILTRKISGAPDYKSRKEFFENRKLNDNSEKATPLTPKKIIRTSSIKDRRASFEVNNDKKIPLQDKTNISKKTTPDTKSRSPDRITESPTKIADTEIFDVKVEESNKSRRLSGSKTIKDRKATFENNDVAEKPVREYKITQRNQSPSSVMNTDRLLEIHTKSTVVTGDTSENVSTKRVTSPNRSKKSPEKPTTIKSINKVSDSTSERVSSKSPDRKVTETLERSTARSPERKLLMDSKVDTSRNRHEQHITTTTKQRTTTTAKTEFGVTSKTASVPKDIPTTIKSATVHTIDDELQIEEIFDLHVLEIMLEKAVGYDRRRRIRAQIRIVKRQLESSKSGKDTTNAITRVSKTVRDGSLAKPQKQNNVTTADKVEFVKTQKTVIKKERSMSPQKSHATPNSNSQFHSPQKATIRSVEESRPTLPQKTVRQTEKARSPSPQKNLTRVEKVRSPPPHKSTPVEKGRSPSPKKVSVVKQQDSRLNKNDKSTRTSTVTSSSSTTVTTTSKVKSEQVSTSLFQEQNVTDLITSSYGVGPTDDNGRPLFGLRALRKTNNNQAIANDSFSNEIDAYTASVSDHTSKPVFGLKALQSENTCTVQESRTVYQEVSEQKGGVDQLITDHKGKPLFGLKALQSIGKNEEPIYEDMPEPPVSPQLKELVLKHEKHAKSSKLDTQPRQKPKAKFRDSFILNSKDEGLYSNFQQNGFTDPNSITLRSIIKKSEDDESNETIVKSKSQSTVFHSKSVMRSDESGNVSVTQDFVKGEVSSVNDQEPSGKLVQGHYTYQSPNDLEAKKGISKVTTVTKVLGQENGPEITDITEEFNSDQIDNKSAKKKNTNDKFESIQKRFSQESFDQDSRRSSKETNGYEKIEGSPHSTPRSSLVRGDSIKALQHKFQQATVSSSLKQNKSAKSESPNTVRQTEVKSVTTKLNSSKTDGSSFLDNNSRVTGVQDVLTRMRNADLVVETGDTSEDIEARALLNKFLGASVILHGMEQGGKSPISNQTTTTSSASLVNQVEKQRAQKSPVTRNNLNEKELDNIWDEKQLQILLESCPDYDQRRKIRARLRQIMAEHKACADVVALANTDDGTAANETNEVTETNSSSSVSGKTGTGSYVKSEVHTKTTTTTSSSNRLTKANSISSSPFAKFQQLERQNSAPKTSK